MKAALANEPVQIFEVPQDIEMVEIDPDSGLLAPPQSPRKIKAAFKKGTAPTKFYDPAEEEKLSEEIMHIFASDLGL